MSGLRGDVEQSGGRMYRYPRSHRLKRRTLIRPVFDRRRGDVRSAGSGAIRALFRFVAITDLPSGVHMQALFAVARSTARGVQRNRLRRRMREAFRIHRGGLELLLREGERALTVAFVAQRDSVDLAFDIQRLLSRLEAAVLRAESGTQKHEKPSGS